MEDLLDVQAVAKILGVRVSTIYKYSMAGKLPTTKVLGNLRFRPSEIQKFIEANSKPSLQAVAS